MGDRLGAALAVGREGTEGCGVVWASLDWGEQERGRGGGEGGRGVAGAGDCCRTHVPTGPGSPERAPLLEGGAEVMMGMSRPSSKSVPKGKFRSTGTVTKGSGTSSTTYKCEIAARKDITSSLFHRE